MRATPLYGLVLVLVWLLSACSLIVDADKDLIPDYPYDPGAPDAGDDASLPDPDSGPTSES